MMRRSRAQVLLAVLIPHLVTAAGRPMTLSDLMACRRLFEPVPSRTANGGVRCRSRGSR